MKTLNLYSFSELGPEAKAKVVRLKMDNPDFLIPIDWDNEMLHGFQEELVALGLTTPEIQYSGFWSQGDGLSFECKVKDLTLFSKSIEKYLTGNGLPVHYLNGKNIEIKFKRISTRYYHEKTVSTQIATNDEILDGEEEYTLYLAVEKWRADLCVSLYRRLSNHYEDLTSEESITSFLEEDDACVWLEDGTPIKH